MGFVKYSAILSLLVVCHWASADIDNPSKRYAVIPTCGENTLITGNRSRQHHQVRVKTMDNHWTVKGHWVSNNETTTFSVIVSVPECKRKLDSVVLTIIEQDENSTAHFYPNGYFRHDRHFYAPDEYCIASFDRASQSSLTVKFCKPDCTTSGKGGRRACIRKCCPLDHIYRGKLGKPFCMQLPSSSSSFMPPLYQDYNEKTVSSSDLVFTENHSPSSNYPMPHFIFNKPSMFKSSDCNVIFLPTSDVAATLIGERLGGDYHGSMFHVRTDGAVMFKTETGKKCTTIRNLDKICVDGVQGALSSDWENSIFHNTEDEYGIFMCMKEESSNGDMDKYLSFTFGVLLLSTSIFPLMTCVVYILLWGRQTVHGWTIAATSGSLFFMYIFHGMAHLIGITLKQDALGTWYCVSLGVLTHFFMLATFTWLTVMSCDLWLTFRSVRPMNQRLQGVPRYLKYSAFGWGVPTIIVGVGISMDFITYRLNNCSSHSIPAYGQGTCYLQEPSLGEYLYYPAGVLLCVNISLFAATCVKLCRYGRGPNIRTRKSDSLGECFSRFSKLFCVMGISWIFEIVGWMVDGLGFVWYWNIFDVFNILRAVGVFVIYVCKKDVIQQLEEVCPILTGLSSPFGKLFMRKCSDEISAESTTFTNLASSPAVPLKRMPSQGENRKFGNRLEVPSGK